MRLVVDRLAGDAIAFAKPLQQVAILAAAAAEWLVLGHRWFAANRQASRFNVGSLLASRIVPPIRRVSSATSRGALHPAATLRPRYGLPVAGGKKAFEAAQFRAVRAPTGSAISISAARDGAAADDLEEAKPLTVVRFDGGSKCASIVSATAWRATLWQRRKIDTNRSLDIVPLDREPRRRARPPARVVRAGPIRRRRTTSSPG